MTETFLGQIYLDGRWQDYARGVERQSKSWWRQDTANRRVVDWIDKGTVLFPAFPAIPRPVEHMHEKVCLGNAVNDCMADAMLDKHSTDHDFRIALQNNTFLEIADQALADGTCKCRCESAWTVTDFWLVTDRAGYLNVVEIDRLAKMYLSRDDYRSFCSEVYVGSGIELDGLVKHQS